MEGQTDTSPSPDSTNPPPRSPEATTPAAARDGARRLPSTRLSLLAAAVTLGAGVAIGAAIGPAPQASFAGSELPGLLGTLLGRAASAAPRSPSATPANEEAAPVAERRKHRHRRKRARASSEAAASTPPSGSTTPTSSTAPTSTPNTPLKPVTSVWLIELSGESFAQALAQPAAAPYIDSQLVPTGTLESSWTALDASAFASDASLAGLHAPAGSPSPIVDQIIQPPCPEATAAGAQCAAGTAGRLAAADGFVKQALALISANALYRAHGLIVVTFASVAQASAAGLPEGAASATLTEQSPVGVLLLSPFIRAGVRSASTFDSTAPMHALGALLGK
jgi:hypothetical protein